MPKVLVGSFNSKPNPINPKPIAAMTCEKRTPKWTSQKTPKLLIVKLTKIKPKMEQKDILESGAPVAHVEEVEELEPAMAGD